MNSTSAYVLSRQYTDVSIDGYGSTIKGISPTVSVTKDGDTTDIDFKYVGASGQEYHEHAYVSDGADGKDGKDGIDGKDGAIGPAGPQGERGETGATGAAGQDGKDGFSPVANVEEDPDGATITITDATGTTSAFVPSGGSGGTSDYNKLSNLPTINGNEAKGELSNDIAAIIDPLSNEDVEDIKNIIDDDTNN